MDFDVPSQQNVVYCGLIVFNREHIIRDCSDDDDGQVRLLSFIFTRFFLRSCKLKKLAQR